MKNIFKRSGIILLVLSVFSIHSCKKENPAPPIVATIPVTEISYSTAVSGGDVKNEGGAPVVSRGICWNTTANPTILNNLTGQEGNLGIFSGNLTQLTPGTYYYVRAYATNSGGTGYGDQVTFTTSELPVPVLTTTEITSFTQSSAISGGNITDDKGYPIIARGVCWGTASNPTTADNKTTDGTGTGNFISNISDLYGNTAYHLRAYATNNIGTGYGNEITMTLVINQPGPQVNDMDGNIYNSVIIGNQTWMSENLKTSKYNSGEIIPSITDNTIWSTLNSPGYAWYNNDIANKSSFGALYNWYAANTGKLCPTGWHVPSDSEYTALTNYLHGLEAAGGKLKEAGTSHWTSPNTSATNESGFTALPGGYRAVSGIFYYIRDYGRWWSSSEFDSQSGWGRGLGYDVYNVSVYGYIKQIGFSVRCIMD